LGSACDLIRERGNSPLTMIVVYGVLVVCGACIAAVIGLAVVQRLVPATIRKEHNDVAGFIYAVLGVIYAVLLALVVIATWEDFGRARDTVETEAKRAGRDLLASQPAP
jgi:prolipoprotein diacylglyceryltransferase